MKGKYFYYGNKDIIWMIELVQNRKQKALDKEKKQRIKNKIKNRVQFDYLERAVNDRLFTGAIPLLFDAGAFACCVSTLGRFAPL